MFNGAYSWEKNMYRISNYKAHLCPPFPSGKESRPVYCNTFSASPGTHPRTEQLKFVTQLNSWNKEKYDRQKPHLGKPTHVNRSEKFFLWKSAPGMLTFSNFSELSKATKPHKSTTFFSNDAHSSLCSPATVQRGREAHFDLGHISLEH